MAARERVLITGGAGFIGSHLGDALAESGHDVTLFDNLEAQVHGERAARRPPYVHPDHRLVVGDVRDPDALAPLVREADVVVHLAALVGVGQSMYQVRRYTDVNTMGAATLLQALVDNPGHVRKVLVASSMSVYGEGAYVCSACGPVAPRQRTREQLDAHEWEVRCPTCGAHLAPVATSEEKPLFPSSVYAINKRDHEEMVLTFGAAYAIPSVALRFWNIYGPRQALSNPYTGVLAIFSSRLLSGRAPLIFEDGEQLRDFVHIGDIVQACLLAMDSSAADYGVFNVGSGQTVSVREVAAILARAFGREDRAEVTETYRTGDVRHCFPSIARLRERVGYEPRVRLEDGIGELVDWVSRQEGVRDGSSGMIQELAAHGLAR